MTKVSKLLALFFLFTGLAAYGQSGQRISTALQALAGSNYAQVIPNASVYVCQYTLPQTCTSTTAIYNNVNLTGSPITQPLVANSQGSYEYYGNIGSHLEEKVCAPYNQCYYYEVYLTQGTGLSLPGCSSPTTGNLLCTGNITAGISIIDSGLAGINTAVVITAYTAGSGYATSSYSLSGGTCSTYPTIAGLEISTESVPVLTSYGSCTVLPTATATGTPGTGATVTLGFAGNSVAVNNSGQLTNSQQSGSGNTVLSNNPTLMQPIIYDSVLGPSADITGYYDYSYLICTGGKVVAWLGGNSGTYDETAISSACESGNNVIGIRPSSASSSMWSGLDSVHFGAGLNQGGGADYNILQLNFFDNVNTGRGSISFNPGTSSINSLPDPEGISWYLSNTGGVINPAITGSGSGYSSPVSCTVTGGNLISGSPETCTASIVSSVLVGTPAGTGVYSTPPTMTVVGNLAAGGTNSFFVRLSIENPNSITGSLFMDLSGVLHLYNNGTPGTLGTDLANISASGSMTLNNSIVGPTLASITPGAALGSGGSYSAPVCASTFTCTAFGGEISFTTGSPVTTGVLLTLNFTTAKPHLPICNYWYIPNDMSSSLFPYQSSATTSTSVAWQANALTINNNYTLAYHCD